MTYLVSPNRISHDIDRMFNQFWRGGVDSCDSCSFVPRVNISESEENVTITFELAGMSEDDIKVAVENNVLTVSGERGFERKDEKDGYVRNEISTGSFSRSFTLPQTVDTNSITADYKHGLLTIALVRKEEAKPKKIEVKVN
ncbi:MAG: Hsp20/alpha crystallin family protein [bacterium]